MRLIGIVKRHLCQIFQVNNVAITRMNHGIIDVGNRLIVTIRFNIEFLATHIKLTPGNIGTTTLDSHNYVVQRDFLLCHFLKINFNAYFLLRIS